VFGYHEIWHVVVVVCSAVQYFVLVQYAIPAAHETAAIASVSVP